MLKPRLRRRNRTIDNTIIDGFKTVDKKVSEYPEINWGPFRCEHVPETDDQDARGKMSTPEEIKKLRRNFLE